MGGGNCLPDNWIMTQEWQDVLFLHWRVSAEQLRKQIPEELELDLYEGEAWIGVVLFKAKGTRPRLLPPVPGTRTFLEVNVRTYVKYKGRSGVYFFTLDANSPLAVKAASFGGFLPYRLARMEYNRHGEKKTFKSRRIHKNSFPETIDLSYQTATNPLKKNKLERWLTERYSLWTKPKRKLLRLDIKHLSWELQYVKGEVRHNSMASFLPENLHLEKPLAHYSSMKKVRFYPPVAET